MNGWEQIKYQFNNMVNGVNDNIIKPVGQFFDNANKWVDEKIIDPIFRAPARTEQAKEFFNDLQKETKPIEEKIKEKINNVLPVTEEEKKELEKITENKINGNIKEESGNLQNNKTISETPTIQELWEREDAIRKETQEREDTAYQRAVEDMRKAGINPNLAGISPANSGGGITNASGMSTVNTEMSGIVSQAIAEINNTVKMNENQKDRITDILTEVAKIIFLKSALKK